MSEDYELIALKRKWCPEWLFAVVSWPIDLVSPRWMPFRWMLTKPLKPINSFKELFDEARQSIGYYIEGCFLAETPEEQEKAEAELLKFISENYSPK